MRRLRRLRRPCEVNCLVEFTDADLMYSRAFRRLAEFLVRAALRPKRGREGVATEDGSPPLMLHEEQVKVSRVGVRRNKLAVEGELENGPLFRVPFRYEISLSVSQDGHILHLREPAVYWGTPGGEVPLPILPQQTFTVDLGDR